LIIFSFSLVISYFRDNLKDFLWLSSLHPCTVGVVKGIPITLGSDKQIFTAAIASLEHHLMTLWMLVAKQNTFRDEDLLTYFVLLLNIFPEHLF